MLKKIFLLIISLVIAHGFAIASDEADTEGEKGNIFENILEIITAPAEEIVGAVIDLERIVVSPSRIQEPVMMSASSIAVIREEDLKPRHARFVKDIVVEQAGVSKTETGFFGGATTIRMRGANPNHTLLIIDNMKVYDPTAVNGAFNFAHLSLDNTEQIEILRGPQSTLYGSDAIGGVINIISKKPYKPFFEAGFEAGSYWTFNEYVNLGGYEEGLHYSFSFSQLNSDGISSADSVTIPNIEEDDSYRRTSLATRLDYEIFDNLTVGATMRHVHARYEYDDSDPISYALRDNDGLIGKSNLLLYSIYVEHAPFELCDYSVRYSYMNNFREDFDYPAGQSDWYEGTVNRFDYQTNFYILDYDVFSIGYDYTHEIADAYYYDFANGMSDQPKVFSRNSALFLQNKVHFRDIIGSTQGMRVDYHSQFGTGITYKVDGFYLAPTRTRIRGVFATGFKAPSLYQLYAPANPAWFFLGGNTNLDPEKSVSYEMGIDQYTFDKTLKLSVTYFHTRFYNLIQYWTNPATYQSTYRNAAKAKSLGMEYGAELNLFDDLIIIKSSLSFLDTKDWSTDREIARVPKSQFNLNVNVRPIPQLNINTNINHTGIRFDIGTDKIKPHTKVDISCDYHVTERITIFARIENVFDEHYQEVRGYGMPGFSVYAGSKIEF